MSKFVSFVGSIFTSTVVFPTSLDVVLASVITEDTSAPPNLCGATVDSFKATLSFGTEITSPVY